MKLLKSIIHFLVALTLTLTNMNLGVFSSLIIYASEDNTMTSFEQPITELNEIFSEEQINLVNPQVDSQLRQDIRQKARDLEQQNLDNQSETQVEEQEESTNSEVNTEEQEESTNSEVNTEEQEESTNSEVNTEEQGESSKSEANTEEQEESSKLEPNTEEQEGSSNPEVNTEEQGESSNPEVSTEEQEGSSNPDVKTEEQEMNEQNLMPRSSGITGQHPGATLYYDEFGVAWESTAGSAQAAGQTVTITFNQNYTLTSKDAQKLKDTKIIASKVIITAAPGVTVTINQDLSFYEDSYTTSDGTVRTIRFENIKLNFTSNSKIALCQYSLEMGTGVEMTAKSPNILFGSLIDRKPSLTYWGPDKLSVTIESGKYNEIIVGSDTQGGTPISIHESTFNLKGGSVEKLLYGRNASSYYECNVTITGGEIKSIEDLGQGSGGNGSILNVNIQGKVTIETLKNIFQLNIGNRYPLKVGDLTVTKHLSVNKSKTRYPAVAISKFSGFTLSEDVNPVELVNFDAQDSSRIFLPANRDRYHVPLTVEGAYFKIGNHVLFGASNTVIKDEFYFFSVTGRKVTQDTIIIDENQEFYIDEIEEYTLSNGVDIYTMKAKKKLTGPLIYDFRSEKLFYVDSNGNEQEAWWFSKKISNGKASLDNLSYNDLTQNEYYYIISPQPLTLKFRGSGNNKKFKFTNEKSTDRQINVEFENLNLTDSELKLSNINTIKLNGTSTVTQSSPNLKALTYSFIQSDAGNRIIRSNDGKFLVHSNDSLGDYNIEAQIINETAADITNNSSISQFSFEDSSSDKTFNFSSVESSRVYTVFNSKANYKNLSILLPTDSEKFILCEGTTKGQSENAYYYQSAASGANQNSGPIGTRITFTNDGPHSYYQVSKKPRVYVRVSQNNNQFYYLDDTLKVAMDLHVAHIGGSHEVIFLGNYNINSDEDVNAVENYNKNTAGITFKTQVDDIKYILTISKDLKLERYASNRDYLVTFDQIKWQFNSGDIKIYADGRSLTFGSDIQTNGTNYPTIMGGHPTTANLETRGTITIQSGTYKEIIGQHNNVTAGTVTINISAGTFKGKVTGTNTTNANASIQITGGTFNDQIIGATGLSQGNVTMNISGGTFAKNIIGASEQSRGTEPITINLTGGTFNGQIIGSNGTAQRNNVTLNISNGTFNNDVIGATGSSQSNVTMDLSNTTFNHQIIGANGNASGNITLAISSGTFASNVIGVTEQATSTLRMTISGGIFGNGSTGVVYGSKGSSSNDVSLTVTGGTFNKNVYGETEGTNSSATVNVTIQNGTFNQPVIGSNGTAQNVTMTISGGTFGHSIAATMGSSNATMTISGGTFSDIVYGSRQGSPSQVSLTITGGIFNKNVYGETECTNSSATVNVTIQDGTFNQPFIGANTAQDVTVTISGGTFAQPIAATMGKSSATMNISGGTFSSIVYGANSSTPTHPTNLEINVTGGTFQDSLIGLNQNDTTPVVNINIDGTVTIPRIKGYDLLTIGKNTASSQLMITEALLVDDDSVNEEIVKLQNQSTLKLGNQRSTVKRLEVVGSGNTLRLNLVSKGTAPLRVKSGYSVSSGDKLKLEVEGNKIDDAWLINFYGTTIDIENFEFTDNDYYIRDIIDSSNNNEHKLTLYEKMSNPTFNWNLTNNQLTVSVNGSSASTPWWVTTSDLTPTTVNLDVTKLLEYKGTTIFKNPLTVNLVLSGTSANRTISLRSTTPTFNLTLNALNLTDSTLNVTNLNQLSLEGENIMKSLNSTSPIFSYSFDGNGGVTAANNQSNLVVYSSNQDSISASGQNIGKVLSLSFDERDNYSGLDLADQTVRLVDDNSNTINYTIPQGTKNMSLLFASNGSTQYHLYHGTSSTTGSSVYVAGIADDTFTDTFGISANNQVTTYQNVRRANPLRVINTTTQADISFDLNLGSSSMNTVTPTNWQQYFSSKPLKIEVLESHSVVDVYTDSNGNTHNFGEIPLTIKTTYEGVELNGNSASLELVSPTDLDPNLTLSTPGAKMALNLVDKNSNSMEISLVQGVSPSTTYSWNLDSNNPLVLDIEPNFDGNNYFFNADLPTKKYQTNHYLKFKFEVIASTP